MIKVTKVELKKNEDGTYIPPLEGYKIIRGGTVSEGDYTLYLEDEDSTPKQPDYWLLAGEPCDIDDDPLGNTLGEPVDEFHAVARMRIGKPEKPVKGWGNSQELPPPGGYSVITDGLVQDGDLIYVVSCNQPDYWVVANTPVDGEPDTLDVGQPVGDFHVVARKVE